MITTLRLQLTLTPADDAGPAIEITDTLEFDLHDNRLRITAAEATTIVGRGASETVALINWLAQRLVVEHLDERL